MSEEMNVLQDWCVKATPAEKIALAELAKTTPGTLDQIKGAYKTKGVLSTTAGLACQIEHASIALQRDGLPPILREDLCAACNGCDLAKTARKAA